MIIIEIQSILTVGLSRLMSKDADPLIIMCYTNIIPVVLYHLISLVSLSSSRSKVIPTSSQVNTPINVSGIRALTEVYSQGDMVRNKRYQQLISYAVAQSSRIHFC